MCSCVLYRMLGSSFEYLGCIVQERQIESKTSHKLIIMANLLLPFDCWDLCSVHKQSQLHNYGQLFTKEQKRKRKQQRTLSVLSLLIYLQQVFDRWLGETNQQDSAIQLTSLQTWSVWMARQKPRHSCVGRPPFSDHKQPWYCVPSEANL